MTMYRFPSMRGFVPRQFGLAFWSAHVPFAYDLISELRPKILVELGTHVGESYFAFCQGIQEHGVQTIAYAVDNWSGDEHVGAYDDSIYESVKQHNDLHYASFSYLLRTDFNKAREQFEDNSIDLLHIDGYHTYEAVKHDFDTWLPKVSKDGIILFHDISGRHQDFGAWRFWDELKTKYDTFTFQQGWGLGVLKKSKEKKFETPLLSAIFSGDAEKEAWIRDYYRLASERLIFQSQLEKATLEVPKMKTELSLLRHKTPLLEKQVDDLAHIVGDRDAYISDIHNNWLNAPRLKRAWRVVKKLVKPGSEASPAKG